MLKLFILLITGNSSVPFKISLSYDDTVTAESRSQSESTRYSPSEAREVHQLFEDMEYACTIRKMDRVASPDWTLLKWRPRRAGSNMPCLDIPPVHWSFDADGFL